MVSFGIEPGDLPSRAAALRQEGQGVMLIAVDGSAAGLVAVADPIKESAVGALKALRDERVRVEMLIGDSRTTAAAVGRKLGIEEVVAEVLPDQKAATVKRLQDEHRFVGMAGDGINDAPALAQAQVGIARGTGADVRRAVLLYLGFAAAGHLLWEATQVPLYTIWRNGSRHEILFAVIHCSAGDALITASALALAALIARLGHWPLFGGTHGPDRDPARPWL
jgi:soluble P-type ATPase